MLGAEVGDPLVDQLRALQDRVREVEEELTKAHKVAAELRTRLAQAEADLQDGASADGRGGAAKGEWVATDELRGKLREAFAKMDLNDDGAVDAEERAKARDLLNALHMEFGLRTDVVFEGAVPYEAFESRHVREWEVALKEQALAGVNLARVVAERLPGGSPETPLSHLQDMSENQLWQFCRTSVAAGVDALLRQQQEALRVGGARGGVDKIAEQGNAKFAQGEGMLTQAQFGKMEDFTKGLVGKIGLPNPRLMEAMEREHCTRGDSKVTFSPGNYATTTTPEAEWQVVTDPEEGERVSLDSVGKRLVRTLAELREDPAAEKAGLLDEEILALLLYTGPMYRKYNAVLRDFPPDAVADLRDNTYATTIHLIVSGVIKLSRCMVLPKDRVVYRGLKNLGLPEAFLKEDPFGVRGGVELGLMSTTEDRGVAIQYAGTNMPTVFKIGVGAVDRGAPIKFLSQYPGEEEILFPPASYLEVTGETRMEVGAGGTVVRVVSLSVNANLLCGTIEEMLGKRRQLHVAMLENYALEIKGELEGKLDSEEVKERLAHDGLANFNADHKKMVDMILEEVGSVVETHKARDAKWYNEDDDQYERAIKEAVQLKKMALGKFQLWVEGADARMLEKESMQVVRRRALADLHRRLKDALRREEEGEGREEEGRGGKRKETEPLELCKELGLLVKSVDETNEEGEPPLVAAASGSGGNVWALGLLVAAGFEVRSATQDEWTSLHWASLLGHMESVACLVDTGADLYAKTETGETCLSLAARASRSEVVGYLVEKGGVGLVMAVDSFGRSSAYMAAEQGRVEPLRMLLKAGGKELLMLKNKDNWSCAFVAARNGHDGALRMLIDAGGKDLLMLTTTAGRSCAYMASQNGQEGALRMLIEAGGKDLLMLTAKNGASCAYMASEYGHVDALKMLIEVGGEQLLMLTDNEGWSCAHSAAAEGHAAALALLIDAGGTTLLMLEADDGRSCAHLAAAGGHAEALGVLIEAGGKELVMLRTDDGASCAHMASEYGHVDALTMLIEVGGKQLLMLTDKNGASCALLASQTGHTDALRMLIEAGGKELLMLTSKNGRSCAHVAAVQGRVEALGMLVEAGGKELVTLTDKAGRSCAHSAASGGHAAALGLLIEAGGTELVMLTDKRGGSCALLASLKGHAEALALLIEAGGKELLMLTDNEGRSCAHLAAAEGHAVVLGLLIKAGGKELLMLNDKNGESCLAAAVRSGHTKTVALLLERVRSELVMVHKESGISCLHFAAAGCNEEAATGMAEMLFAAGGVELLAHADSRLGWTPLHNAVYAGHSLLVGKMSEWMEHSLDVEEVRRSVEALQEANMGIFRGMPQMAPVDSREGLVDFFELSTVRSTKGCRAGCKCYYEVTILRVDQSPQIGFATSEFERVRTHTSNGTGDDDHSWGVDGSRLVLFHRGDGDKYEAKWQEGDVVGLACDLEKGQIEVSVNGSFEAPNGVVFEKAGGFEGEVYAAISGASGRLRYNLGDRPFAYAPPASDFEAFCSVEAL